MDCCYKMEIFGDMKFTGEKKLLFKKDFIYEDEINFEYLPEY